MKRHVYTRQALNNYVNFTGLSDVIWREFGPDIWLSMIIEMYEALINLSFSKEVITREELRDFCLKAKPKVETYQISERHVITLFDTYLGYDTEKDSEEVNCSELIKSFDGKVLQTLNNYYIGYERFNAEKLRELLDLMLIIDERKISDQESFKPLYM